VARFATKDAFTSYNGTAPIDVSSGDQIRHLPRREPADQPRPPHDGGHPDPLPRRPLDREEPFGVPESAKEPRPRSHCVAGHPGPDWL